MTRISPQEAFKITYECVDFQETQYAVKLYQHIFDKKQALDARDSFWNTMCAISAVYQAGKIDGIRAERERRRTGKKVHV